MCSYIINNFIVTIKSRNQKLSLCGVRKPDPGGTSVLRTDVNGAVR